MAQHDLLEAGRILEGTADREKREVVVDLIREGFGNPRDNHYYAAKVLREAAARFDGAKMYANHLSPELQRKLAGMPRDIQDVMGRIREAAYIEPGARHDNLGDNDGDRSVVRARVSIAQPWLWNMVEHDPELLGVSINARGSSRVGTVEGREAKIVEGIAKVNSVDWVTEAGAGGKVIAFVESQVAEEAAEAEEEPAAADPDAEEPDAEGLDDLEIDDEAIADEDVEEFEVDYGDWSTTQLREEAADRGFEGVEDAERDELIAALEEDESEEEHEHEDEDDAASAEEEDDDPDAAEFDDPEAAEEDEGDESQQEARHRVRDGGRRSRPTGPKRGPTMDRALRRRDKVITRKHRKAGDALDDAWQSRAGARRGLARPPRGKGAAASARELARQLEAEVERRASEIVQDAVDTAMDAAEARFEEHIREITAAHEREVAQVTQRYAAREQINESNLPAASKRALLAEHHDIFVEAGTDDKEVKTADEVLRETVGAAIDAKEAELTEIREARVTGAGETGTQSMVEADRGRAPKGNGERPKRAPLDQEVDRDLGIEEPATQAS